MSARPKDYIAVKNERFKFSVPPRAISVPLFVRQEFDEAGHHRLVCVLTEANGEWVKYESISKLDMGHDYIFYGTSDHYRGALPRVFLAYEPKRIGGDG
jgi:hypothetical protein